MPIDFRLEHQVRKLVSERKEAGYHRIVWNGRDNVGQTVANGIYFYRLQMGDRSITNKMLFLK